MTTRWQPMLISKYPKYYAQPKQQSTVPQISIALLSQQTNMMMTNNTTNLGKGYRSFRNASTRADLNNPIDTMPHIQHPIGFEHSPQLTTAHV